MKMTVFFIFAIYQGRRHASKVGGVQNFEGGVVDGIFRPDFEGGVVDELRQFEGGVVDRFFRLDFEGG